MRNAACWSLILAAISAAIPGHAATVTAQPTPEQIGTWVLSCPPAAPGSGPCLMRLNPRFIDKAGITGDLEVQAQGRTLVPVIAVHGLSRQILAAASMAGRTEASIQFAGSRSEDLTCAASATGYMCTPDSAAGVRLAAELPAARAVTVRVSVVIEGMKPLPAQEKSQELSGTNNALVRLRALGPPSVPSVSTDLASPSSAGLAAMADKALKAAGYQNGVAGLEELLAKHMKNQ